MLSKALCFLWKYIKWALLIAVILIILAVAINWRDEPLSGEARTLLAERPVDVPDRENIYVVMAGMDAPDGQDVLQVGRKWIEEAKQESTRDLWDITMALRPENQEKSAALQWQKAEPAFYCDINKAEYFGVCLHEQRDRLEKTLVINKTLVQRYLLLQKLPCYAAPPTSLIGVNPAIGNPIILISVQNALRMQAISNIEMGNTQAGLTFFKQDMALWRKALDGKSDLLYTMITLAQLTRDAQGISFILSSPNVRLDAQATEWRALLTPLTHEQYSLRPVIQGEAGFFYDISQKLKKGRWVSYQEVKKFCNFLQTVNICVPWREWINQNFYNNINIVFFQPNATFNRNIPFYATWLKLADFPWKDYIKQRDKSLALLASLSKPGIDWIYNPVGKVTPMPLDIYDEYMGRIHDANTYLSLVRLQLELRLAHVPAENIPAFIRQQGQACCAVSADFSWDAQARRLSFKPYGKSLPAGIPPSVEIPAD